MYLGTILLSALVARLRRGSFLRLGQVTLRAVWAIALALALQLGVHLVTRWQWDWPHALKTAMYLLSYACLLAALWANRRLPGVSFLSAAVLLNLLVICVNGGHMPVSEAALLNTGQEDFCAFLKSGQSPTHALIGPGTRLWFMADILHFPWSPPLRTVFSLGDIVLMVGLFVMVQGIMVPSRAEREAAAGRGVSVGSPVPARPPAAPRGLASSRGGARPRPRRRPRRPV